MKIFKNFFLKKIFEKVPGTHGFEIHVFLRKKFFCQKNTKSGKNPRILMKKKREEEKFDNLTIFQIVTLRPKRLRWDNVWPGGKLG